MHPTVTQLLVDARMRDLARSRRRSGSTPLRRHRRTARRAQERY